jgi:multiple sugar transport system substrate-binding protein
MKKWCLAGASAILCTALLAGCGSSDSGAGSSTGAGSDSSKKTETAKPAEPITLSIGVATFANGEYDKVFSKVVAQKFPNITLEKLEIGGDGSYEKNILSKGLKPDIIITGLGTNFLIPLKETGLAVDQAPMAKAANLDLNQLDKVRMNLAINLDGNPDLTVIPYSLDTAALYYNKDIFDRFGAAYPKDHMTWDQVIELAKKLTRNDNGVQYRGLEPDAVDRPAGQLGLLTVDPKTNKAAVNSDGWKQVFARLKQVYDIPGNEGMNWFAKARDEFSKTKDLAMFTGFGPDGFDAVPDLNWDLATYPVLPNAPGTTLALGGRGFAVTSLSTHKQEAFDLIKWWVSDEVQKKLSATGIAPALNTKAAQDAFGTDLAGFKGKHMQALFMLQPATQAVATEYEPDGAKVIRAVFTDMINKNMDVNTALRTAEEQINKAIEQKQSQ